MKLFRLRFIILGLLLCIFHVWCRTCDTDFTDTMSSAYLSYIIVEGRVAQSIPTRNGLFDNSVRITRFIKGTVNKARRRIRVSGFGSVIDQNNCVHNLTRGSAKYVFYLKPASIINRYVITAFPERSKKKVLRSIRKIMKKNGGKLVDLFH